MSRLEGTRGRLGPLPGGPRLLHPIPILAPMRTCYDCHEGRDHCHETLVEHGEGWLECPDAACDADRLRHAWVVPCPQLAPPCGCGDSRETAGGRAPGAEKAVALAA